MPVLWIILFYLGGIQATYLVCHDCSQDSCLELNPHQAGKCRTPFGGKCFFRKDPNGLTYRGCADDKKWPELDYSYNGCRHQYYAWWDETPVLWCFCDSSMCNTNITEISDQYSGSTYRHESNGKYSGTYQGHAKSYSQGQSINPGDAKSYTQGQFAYQNQLSDGSQSKGSKASGYYMVSGMYGHGQPKGQMTGQSVTQTRGYVHGYGYNTGLKASGDRPAGSGDAMQGQRRLRMSGGRTKQNVPSSGTSTPRRSRGQVGSRQGRTRSINRGTPLVMRPGPNSVQGQTNSLIMAEKNLWAQLYNELVVGAASDQNQGQGRSQMQGPDQAPMRHISPAAREGPDMRNPTNQLNQAGGTRSGAGTAKTGSLLKDLTATKRSGPHHAIAYGPQQPDSAHTGNDYMGSAHPGAGKPGLGYLGMTNVDGNPAGQAHIGQYGQTGAASVLKSGYVHGGAGYGVMSGPAYSGSHGTSYGHNAKAYDGFGKVILMPSPPLVTGGSDAAGGTSSPAGNGGGDVDGSGAKTGHDMLGQGSYTKQPFYTTTGTGPLITLRPVTPSPSGPDGKSGEDSNEIDSPVFTLKELYDLLVSTGQIVPDGDTTKKPPVPTTAPPTNAQGTTTTPAPTHGATPGPTRRHTVMPPGANYGRTTMDGHYYYGGSYGTGGSISITSSLLPGGGIAIDIPVGTSRTNIKQLRAILQAMSPSYYYFLQGNNGVAKMGGLPFYPVAYAQSVLIPYPQGLGGNSIPSISGESLLDLLLRAGFGIGGHHNYNNGMSLTCSSLGCDHICKTRHGKPTCTCKRGYQLQSDAITCTDGNECDESNGGCGQLCVNTVGSYHCSCFSEGYELGQDGKICIDINECHRNNGGCGEFCENSEGSYRCYCPPGYQLERDEKRCIDTNECRQATGNSCEQLCSNAAGAYQCDCYKGYTLDPFDQRSCDDMDECYLTTHECDQQCVNTAGSYQCQCERGYTLARNGRTCLDENECLTNNGDCSQRCMNTAGAYECHCNGGYRLNTDRRTCDDANECQRNNGNCSQICENVDGSYRCLCETGYMLDLDGLSCRDINECLENSGGCEHTCQNILGSYQCSCYSGYSLNTDKHRCDGMNACAADNGGCDHICTKTSVGRRCSCRSGYRLDTDGTSCVDENECLLNNGGCSHFCRNSLGSYQCTCRAGFQLDPDRLSCNDVDECLTNNGGCGAICQNAIGSYYCSCNRGFKLADDNRRCLDINECLIGKGGCEEVCTNSIGSYRCSCNSDLYRISLEDAKKCIGICPAGFTQPNGLHSCYKVYTDAREARSVHNASLKCQSEHPGAQLASLENPVEQEYFVGYLRDEPEMLEGWQGWWTGGAYREGMNQFQWRTSSNQKYIERNSKYWGFKRLPYEDTCLWVLQIPAYNYTWGNYDCNEKSGFICEIQLTKKGTN